MHTSCLTSMMYLQSFIEIENSWISEGDGRFLKPSVITFLLVRIYDHVLAQDCIKIGWHCCIVQIRFWVIFFCFYPIVYNQWFMDWRLKHDF